MSEGLREKGMCVPCHIGRTWLRGRRCMYTAPPNESSVLDVYHEHEWIVSCPC